MEENQVVRALSALAQPVRLQVFRALVVMGETGLTPGAMAEGLNIPANTLSFHLKELSNAGLITSARSSRNLIYRASFHHMRGVLGYLTENCCERSEATVESSTSCAC